MRLSLGLLPPLCFLLFGLVMIYGSLTMEPSFSGTNEHRWVPLGMSVFVSALAGYLVLSQMAGREGDTDPITVHGLVFLILPCIALLAAYAQGTIWFGYAAPTFICGVLIFRLFRNAWLSSVVQSVIATLVLYVVFFKLLKLYNPPGRWLDLQLPF